MSSMVACCNMCCVIWPNQPDLAFVVKKGRSRRLRPFFVKQPTDEPGGLS